MCGGVSASMSGWVWTCMNTKNYVAIMTIGCEASSGHVHTLSGAYPNVFERAP